MREKFNSLYQLWIESCGEEEPDYDSSYGSGWNNCKKATLEILDKYRHVPGIHYVKEEIDSL